MEPCLISWCRQTICNAVVYLKSAQKPDGGWVGSWGICFTYASQFALESLSLVGETYENSEHAQRACKFLLRKQRRDGGWGESYKVFCILATLTQLANLKPFVSHVKNLLG